ncbi:histidine--tRNA ligase [Bacillota bacterium LX-D]|nr:histidine--tRNA ligase [Bacillota bacterium LX-D]
MLTTRPRGTNDILPGDVEHWRYLESVVHNLCSMYNYHEIRTPIFEHTELFARGVGNTTDIVEKEMYSFQDRGERNITLRPEGTAPTVRAFLENKIYSGPQPTKFYYMGPMFRYGRPQAGRFRQFHQFGVEVLGSQDPSLDAEVIALAMDYYKRLELKGLELHINSVGCPECRSVHKEKLKEFLQPNIDLLCSTCRQRYEKNPLRIFDCKSEDCQKLIDKAPTITDCLCEDCSEHFFKLQSYLKALNIDFILDSRLVRGLDYYTKTAFEVMVQGIGAQSSIGGGGRYDHLVEICGGSPTPGIGFAVGLERILLTMEQQGLLNHSVKKKGTFIATTASGQEIVAVKLLHQLRNLGISAEKDYLGRSLKAQLKYAYKLDYEFVLILGEEELTRGCVVLKTMETGQQKEIKLENVSTYIVNVNGGNENA